MSRSISSLSIIIGATFVVAFASGAVEAETPIVVFDAAQSVTCKDVTPTGLKTENATSKLVEVVLNVSVALSHGSENDIKHVVVEIVSPERRHPLKRYLPSTEVVTDVADGIIYLEERRYDGTVDLVYFVAPRTGRVNGNASSVESKVTLKKLAPKQVLVASSTVERSHGASFRLKPSTQNTLQRSWEFSCVFEVPSAFRADYLTVKCSAVGVNRGVISALDSDITVGRAEFAVGVYVDGDVEAKEASDGLSKSQQLLFDEVAKQRTVLDKKAADKAFWSQLFFYVLTLMLDKRTTVGAYSPMVSSEIVRGIAVGTLAEGDLPGSVFEHVHAFAQSKEAIKGMSGR